jgi:hypothetical protein
MFLSDHQWENRLENIFVRPKRARASDKERGGGTGPEGGGGWAVKGRPREERGGARGAETWPHSPLKRWVGGGGR